jgi:hypothetical protein
VRRCRKRGSRRRGGRRGISRGGRRQSKRAGSRGSTRLKGEQVKGVLSGVRRPKTLTDAHRDEDDAVSSKSRVETPATHMADAREAGRTSTHVRRGKLRVEVGEAIEVSARAQTGHGRRARRPGASVCGACQQARVHVHVGARAACVQALAAFTFAIVRVRFEQRPALGGYEDFEKFVTA